MDFKSKLTTPGFILSAMHGAVTFKRHEWREVDDAFDGCLTLVLLLPSMNLSSKPTAPPSHIARADRNQRMRSISNVRRKQEHMLARSSRRRSSAKDVTGSEFGDHMEVAVLTRHRQYVVAKHQARPCVILSWTLFL